jgi:hypothetical protein
MGPCDPKLAFGQNICLAVSLRSTRGDGRRLQAHEAAKRTMKDLVLSNPSLGGAAFPSSSILIEPPHLRSDRSRHGDILALGRGVHRMDTAINLVITSGLTKSCLSSSSKSSDVVLKGADGTSQVREGQQIG